MDDEETKGILRMIFERLDQMQMSIARIELIMTSVMHEQKPEEERR